jgi:hypothetical protein
VGARLGHERGGCSSRGGGSVSAQWSPRHLHTGMAITVVVRRVGGPYFLQTRLGRRGFGRRRQWTASEHGWDDRVIHLEEESIEWCRGHEGKAVDALRVAAAL